MQITKQDIKYARVIYWMQLAAGLIFMFNEKSYLSFFIYGLIAIPITFFLAFSACPLIKAHARQGLVMCVVGIYCLFYGSDIIIGGLGVVWIVLSIGGLIQASNRRSWIGGIRANPLNAPQPGVSTPVVNPLEDRSPDHAELERTLAAFRSGDEAARTAAKHKLEQMGKVETF